MGGGWGTVVKGVRCSPGDSNVSQNLRTTGLGGVLESSRLLLKGAGTLFSGSDSVGRG